MFELSGLSHPYTVDGGNLAPPEVPKVLGIPSVTPHATADEAK